MRRALILAGAVVGLLGSAPAPAAAQQNLDDMLQTLAYLWERGDAETLADYIADVGVEFEINGEPMGALNRRKVAAALRRVFQEAETLSVVASMTSRVSGAEDRAFGELTWQKRPRGATMPERRTVFMGLVRERKGWRVTQIRIFP